MTTHELRVFSSLRGEEMDLSRTKATGVRDLKHFLEFAERGPRALAEAHHGSQGDFDSPFEAGVASALDRKGWQVHTQIGASTFRVDLGVVHPDFTGRYLAGVECDGATYHRSATARDRDKLREQVLHGLGWQIVRVWSTDWWVDPGGTLERVHAKLTALLEGDRQQRASDEADAAVDANSEASDDTLTGSALAVEPAAATARAAARSRPAAEAVTAGGTEAGAAIYARAASALPGVTSDDAGTHERPVFQVSQPADAVPAGSISSDLFFELDYDRVLKPMVEWVVHREGPILDAMLARRIARAHGFRRTGSRIQDRVAKIAQRLFTTTEESGGTFYWPRGVESSGDVSFRWPTDDDSARGVDEICEAELVSLARLVQRRGYSGQEAVIEMARELGLQRLREASTGRLEAALMSGLPSVRQ